MLSPAEAQNWMCLCYFFYYCHCSHQVTACGSRAFVWVCLSLPCPLPVPKTGWPESAQHPSFPQQQRAPCCVLPLHSREAEVLVNYISDF